MKSTLCTLSVYLPYPEPSINCPDYVGVMDGYAEVTSNLLTIVGGG